MRLWLKIAVVILVVLVVLIVSVFAAIFFDLASYTATGSETLNPTGSSVGRALVVYDPGVTGAAQGAANQIASDLQARHYTVDLAGVRSGTAGNTSGYSVIVAGGPMYFGQVSSSIDGYLKTLPSNGRLGVFGSTGSGTFSESDFVSLGKQAATDTHNSNIVVELILSGNETQNCADLVSALLS